MKYNKLVRDKIPEYVRSKGGNPVFRVADDTEYWQKLKEKLREEAEEFEKDEKIDELADILEIIYAICDYKNFDLKEIESIRGSRAKERGRFKDKIILEES